MEKIHDSVKHFKFRVLNININLFTEIKVSTRLFFSSRLRNTECLLASTQKGF